jgi:hypothetical protein
MMTPGYRTSSSLLGMEITNKHIGSSNWRKGKWQGSPRSMFWGKPHLSQRYMPLWCRGKKMSWDPFMPYLGGSGHYSLGRPPTTVHCLSTLKSPMIGEWSAKFSNFGNSSIICQTSASESPIWRPKPGEYHRPSPRQKEGWSSPISTTLHPISTSSAALSPELKEEGEILEDIIGSGTVWSPSRWGHLV